MRLNYLESRQLAHSTRTSGFHRMRALLRCLADSDEQYKHWPPLFGTESYWRWQLIKIRPVLKTLDVTDSQPDLSASRFLPSTGLRGRVQDRDGGRGEIVSME